MYTSDIPEKKKIIDITAIPEEVNMVPLNRLQKEKFAEGQAVFLHNMQLPDGRIVDGKVKLTQDENNQLQVQIFEKKEVLEIPNEILSYKLSSKDKEDLLAEKTVGIKIPSGKTLFLQIDKDLNRVMVQTERDLSMISEVGNYKLTERDKLAWANGEKLPTKIFYDQTTNSHFAASIRKTEDGKGIEYHNYKSLKDLNQNQVKDLIKKFNESPDIITATANVTNSIKVNSVETQKDTTKNYGSLKDHGAAPYENNNDNSMSYYATIQTVNGDKTIWGIDLQRAIHESKVSIGDDIKLDFLGKQPVQVEVPVKNEKGDVVSLNKIDSHRNTWNVELVRSHKMASKEVNTSHDNDRRFVEYTNNKDFEGLKRLAQEGYKPEKELIDKTAQQLNLSTQEKKAVMSAIGNETQKNIPVIKQEDHVILTLNNKPYKVLEISANGSKALIIDSQNKKIGVSIEHIRHMSKQEKGLYVGSSQKIKQQKDQSIQM